MTTRRDGTGRDGTGRGGERGEGGEGEEGGRETRREGRGEGRASVCCSSQLELAAGWSDNHAINKTLKRQLLNDNTTNNNTITNTNTTNHHQPHRHRQIRGLRVWATNEYKHSGIRDDGARIFDRLLSMARDVVPLE